MRTVVGRGQENRVWVMTVASAATREVNVTRLIDDGPLTRFQIGTIICCALVSALDGIDFAIDRRCGAVHRRRARCQARRFWPDILIGAGWGDHRRRVLRPAGGSLRPQNTADCRSAPDRRVHDPDGLCQFRSDAGNRSRVGRFGPRRGDAVLYRLDLGIHAGTAARGAGHADVVGVPAWRPPGRAIELVSDPARGLAGDLLSRRRRAAGSCRGAVFLPAGIDQIPSGPA